MIDLQQVMTQAEFGALIGISQPAVSDLCSRGVLTNGGTVGEWLQAYCSHLREVAAGRGGDSRLATERALLSREQRQKIAMQNAVTRRELAPVRLIEEVLGRVGSRVGKLLDTITPELRRRAPALTSDDLAAIAGIVTKARNMAAKISLAELEIDEDLTVMDAISDPAADGFPLDVDQAA